RDHGANSEPSNSCHPRSTRHGNAPSSGSRASNVHLPPSQVAGGPVIRFITETSRGEVAIPFVTGPAHDQRGAVRGAASGGGINAGNTVDIGVFEASSEYRVTTAVDTNDLGTLRTGVGWANVNLNANPANINPSSPTFKAPNTVDFSSPQSI